MPFERLWLDCLDFKEKPASVSALVQQWSKLLPEALEHLFHKFTDHCHKTKLYRGYRLLAVDGSDLQFTPDPNDPLYYLPEANGQITVPLFLLFCLKIHVIPYYTIFVI